MIIKRTYGECARSGKRVPLEQLVEDGHIEGQLVAQDWYEPKHPQEEDVDMQEEEHIVPAPELSKPDGEGEAAQSITFDATGKLTFA